MYNVSESGEGFSLEKKNPPPPEPPPKEISQK